MTPSPAPRPASRPPGLRALAVFALLLALLLLAGCDPTEEGRAAWREGRTRDAYACFERAAREAGDDASGELLADLAIAALASGEYEAAEAAARRAAERGGEGVRGLADFVRGNAAFARSEAAEEEARRPGGDPTAHAWAIACAEDALAAWRAAAASREDWPPARRNVERALLWMERLRERKTTGGEPERPPDAPPPPRPPPPPPPLPTTVPAEADRMLVVTTELPADAVKGLLDALARKEREKIEARRARRAEQGAAVEKDW